MAPARRPPPTEPGGNAAAKARPQPKHALVLLAVLVTGLHLWLVDSANLDRFGLGSGSPDAMPARMQVAFVRELAQKAPPAVAPAAAPPAAPRPAPRVAPPDAAASQPQSVAVPPPAEARAVPPEAPPPVDKVAAAVVPPLTPDSAAALPGQGMAAPPAPPPQTAEDATAASPAPVPLAAASSAAETFAWPPSTRLNYTLTGNFRGPVQGQAQVEWLLNGGRYQVHMDLSIGPAFAPLASRRVSSEGLVTAQGLAPQRYDEVTRALLRQDQRHTVWLDADRVRLANGRTETRPAGVQDSASQFVHLTWLFTTQPALLQAGQSITLPLALPRHLESWVYDVLGAQTLPTPFGDVQTFHVKPRRPPTPGRDLTAELWVAPSLQYLPVRIVIRQDEQTHLDLLLARLPQQALTPR